MSAERRADDPNLVSPAGDAWRSMVSDLLACEFDRRQKLEARGGTLLAASSTLLTLIFGLSVLVSGKDHVFVNHWAVVLLIAALLAFVVSAVIAIFVQTYSFKYAIVSCKSLSELAGTDASWAQSADHAVRADVSQRVRTICSLRSGNDAKARLVMWGLSFQVIAISALSVSVALELWSRI